MCKRSRISIDNEAHRFVEEDIIAAILEETDKVGFAIMLKLCIHRKADEEYLVHLIKTRPVSFKQILLSEIAVDHSNSAEMVCPGDGVGSCRGMNRAVASVLSLRDDVGAAYLKLLPAIQFRVMGNEEKGGKEFFEEVGKIAKKSRCIVLKGGTYKLHRKCSKEDAYGLGGMLGIAFLHRVSLQSVPLHEHILESLAGERVEQKDGKVMKALVHGFQDTMTYWRDHTLYERYQITGKDLEECFLGDK